MSSVLLFNKDSFLALINIKFCLRECTRPLACAGL